MHIGYVLKKFPRLSETFFLNEILELQRQGVTVTPFSLHRPDDGVFHSKLAELASPVVYLPPHKSAAVLERLRSYRSPLGEARAGLWQQFEDLLAAGRPDLFPVLTWGIDVAMMARERGIDHLHAHFATVAAHVARTAHGITGIPFSVTCHAKDIYREGVDPERFVTLCRDSRFLVTVCEANKKHIIETLGGGGCLRVEVVYNGVDLQTFHPEGREPQQPPLVLGVGRLVEKKGFDVLIEAVAKLQARGVAVECVIVGEGDQRQPLEELARKLGAPVRLVGAINKGDVIALMARAAVLALPCVVGADGNRDALPTVLLEALAAGVPVVSTPVSGVPEIVDGGRCGVLVPQHDAAALQQELHDLLGDPDRCRELAVAGRARAEDLFDLRCNAGRLRALFAGEGGGG